MPDDKSGNTPAADTNQQTSAGGEQTPSQSSSQLKVEDQGDKGYVVTFKNKEEYDKLQKSAAQASEAQSRADTLQGMLDRKGKRKVEDPAGSFDQKEVLAAVTGLSAKILQNAKYQKLVAGNPLLAKVLATRPWELLETDEFADSSDLVDQVLDRLDGMVLATPAPTETPTAQPTPKEEPKAPQPTAVNPSGSGSPTSNENKEQSKRGGLQTTVDKVADSLLGRINIK